MHKTCHVATPCSKDATDTVANYKIPKLPKKQLFARFFSDTKKLE